MDLVLAEYICEVNKLLSCERLIWLFSNKNSNNQFWMKLNKRRSYLTSKILLSAICIFLKIYLCKKKYNVVQ